MEYVVREAIGSSDRLLEALRTLAGLPDRRSILDRIPRLAMELCVARGVRLVEIGEGRPAIVAACSSPHAGGAGEALRPENETTSVQIALGASTRLALVVEREPGAPWTTDELRHLNVFAFVSSIML
jgi:hypothetical protein